MQRQRLRSIAALAILLLIVLASPALAQDSRSLYWERWDTDATINTDGSVTITETQEIVFSGGPFRFGTRDIPTDRLSGISDFQITADGQPLAERSGGEDPGTFVVSEAFDEVRIKWFLPEPTSDSRHVYTITYTVDDALRYYDDGDQFWWKAVGPDRSFVVLSAQAVVHVPEPAVVMNYDNYGVRGTAEQNDDQTVTFDTQDPMSPGEEFEIRVQFTHGVVAGSASRWQAVADEEAAEKERQAAYDANVRPLVDLGFLALGILMVVGGPLLVYLLWYAKGRDKPVALPTDYLAEPPDPTLPAGMAGTLVDEDADMEDIIATLVDLARRGVLTITEEKDGDFTYQKVGDTASLRKYEKTLVDAVFAKGDSRQLSALKDKFYTTIPKLKKQLYEATVQEGFFTTSPDLVRNSYAGLGIALLVLAAIGGFCLAPVPCAPHGRALDFGCGTGRLSLLAFTGLALIPALGLGITAIAFIVVAHYMPRKTDKGAEASARWLAFKRYLQDIEKYSNLEESKSIFETYLAYAIAFGIDRSWINKFSRVDAPVPTWWVPYPSYGPVIITGGPGMPGSGGLGRPAGEMSGGGSLSDMSRGLGGGLSTMSAGLGTMLSSAASTLTSRPQPSSGTGSSTRGWSGGGGGWSGGGGFGGGGGGGGGGGFG